MEEVEKAEAVAEEAAAAVVEAKDTVVMEEVYKAEAVAEEEAAAAVEVAKDRISMQQRVCYACGALLRREQTGTCSRTGIVQPA